MTGHPGAGIGKRKAALDPKNQPVFDPTKSKAVDGLDRLDSVPRQC